MLSIARLDPTSIVFVADNDTDLRVFEDKMTGANSHVSTLDSPDRREFRRLGVQYTVPEGGQPVSPVYSRDAFAFPTPGATQYGVAITFADAQDQFSYEDIRSVIGSMNSRGMGDKPPLLSEKTVQDLLQYARTNLEAYKTLFVPNADNPTLEVDAESGVSILFNQRHRQYDPVRAAATSLELSLAIDPDTKFITSDVTRLSQGANLTGNNQNSVDDLTTIQALTQTLVKNDWLAPSEAEDFIHDVRAARVSAMATSMLRNAERNVQIGHNFEAGEAINRAETVKQLTPLLSILSELRQAGDFCTLSQEQLQTLSLINQKNNWASDAGESRRGAGAQAFSELTRGFHNRDELSAMLLHYAPEIETALTRSIEANAIGAAPLKTTELQVPGNIPEPMRRALDQFNREKNVPTGDNHNRTLPTRDKSERRDPPPR